MLKVLVTGMSGLIGTAVRKRLDGKYQLTALNRSKLEGVECYQADISDYEAIAPAFKDKQVVVHLANNWRGESPWEANLRYSVIGTYNVFEASRHAGVERVIYASSGATVSGYELNSPYKEIVEGKYDQVPSKWNILTHESPIRPKNIYGCAKVWGEALARQFADTYGISMICLRIGFVNAEDRPLNARHLSVWCSQRDVSDMIMKCVEAPQSLKFDIFYVVSRNKWNYRDLEHAREVLGFVPKDTADSFQSTMT